ncbi:methylamine utilization protein [Pseudidiomarina gelatinasegens]|uniref:Methylamine utilization protein n=1 Tax=Pseudidiomarina gelatinasegens TaxID=2487740 RepID=A0A443Z750_9GAMM|nr:methylamine utilization protein [Pseudidiomarina gelatinasegens]RWU12725.1 methylamine utilization protein [Pseudidiomarina gelatinasegens]
MTKFQIPAVFFTAFIAAFAVLCSPTSAAQAQVSLTVTVLDANGKPLPHAIVSVADATNENSIVTDAVMDQVDKLFSPFVLNVSQGSSVSFPNSDNIRHQVYSFSPTKPFELPLYSNQQAPELRFDEPGIVVLGCNIHDHMKAYIYVSPHGYSVQTNAAGQAELPNGVSQFHVWYPGLTDTITDELVVEVVNAETNLTVNLPVLPQAQNPPPPSALQQRFNRRKNNN